MTDRTSAITVGVFSLVLICGVVGYAVYASTKQDSPRQNSNQTPISTSDDSSSSLNVTSSSAVPLGNLPGENNSQGGASTGAGSSSTTNNSSNNKATVDPKTFKDYEKYKTAQNALFGDVTVGTGAEIKKGSRVAVNYRGWLTDGTMFDENVSRDKPLIFTVGEGKVVAGFEQGVLGMKVGGERLVIIPPAAGYGALSQGPIPGNSVLVFDVTALDAAQP